MVGSRIYKQCAFFLIFALCFLGSALCLYVIRATTQFESTLPGPVHVLTAKPFQSSRNSSKQNPLAVQSESADKTDVFDEDLPVFGSRFATLPAVQSYLARAYRLCGNHHEKGDCQHFDYEHLPRNKMSDTSYNGSVLVLVKPFGGLGNGFVVLETLIMVAWLTKRPMIVINNRQHLLRSSCLSPPAQITSSSVLSLFGHPRQSSEIEEYNVLMGQKGSVPLMSGYRAKLRLAETGEHVWIDALEDASKWDLPPHASNGTLLVQALIGGEGTWTNRSTQFAHDLLWSKRKVKQTLRELSIDRKHVNKCALRYVLGWPGPTLFRVLHQSLTHISGLQVLVAIHVRMGDAHIQEETRGGSPAKSAFSDNRTTYDSLVQYYSSVNALLDALAERVKPRRVTVFIASDTEKSVRLAREHLSAASVFSTRGKPVHTNGAEISKKLEKDGIAKAFADWFLLAMSSILLSPTQSTFSISASHMGMQRIVALGTPVQDDLVREMGRLSIEDLL